MRLTRLLSALVLAATASGFASTVSAQTSPSNPVVIPVSPRTLGIDAYVTSQPNRLSTIPEVFNRAFFDESGDFYRNRSIPRQIQYFFGPGIPGRNFPEMEIARDGRQINRLYRQVLEQQLSSGPVIRTPDLPNPFDTSLLRQPGFVRLNQVEGREFFLETLPPR